MNLDQDNRPTGLELLQVYQCYYTDDPQCFRHGTNLLHLRFLMSLKISEFGKNSQYINNIIIFEYSDKII